MIPFQRCALFHSSAVHLDECVPGRNFFRAHLSLVLRGFFARGGAMPRILSIAAPYRFVPMKMNGEDERRK
jgi:hypothetical protein